MRYNEPSPDYGRLENTKLYFFNKLQRCVYVCGGDRFCELKTNTAPVRYHCTPIKMARIKMTSAGQKVEKLKPLYIPIPGSNIKWAAGLEKFGSSSND